MQCHIRSLYLCVKDMYRAIEFYENFFEKEVFIKDDETHVYGSNCLPSIDVENLDVLKNKIKNLKLCFPLTKINNNWVVEFIDSEGNHIELTAPIK